MIDAAERELLVSTVRAALSASDDADQALDELGWREMLTAETDDAIAIVFEELGRANASATALDDVVAHACGCAPRADLAVLHPPFGRWTLAAEGGGVDGIGTARTRHAGQLLVARDHAVVSVATASATVAPISGIDAGADMHTLRVALPNASPSDVHWDHAVALARRALAHQIAGATSTMLDLARTHALERVQFGRPIASFQAVRHRLAECLVAIEALEAVLQVAADEPGPETAALAKAVAGRTARIVGAHAQQVLAGMGFTTDHAFHRYLKRTMLLDGLYGSGDTVTRELGRSVVVTGRVPTLVEL